MDAEFSDSLARLKREFPELSDEVIIQALNESGNNLELAKRSIQSKFYDEQRAFEAETSVWSGLSNIFSGADAGFSMRDLQDGINNLSATVSLASRSVVHTISSILPDEINPFIEYIEDDEEYEAERLMMEQSKKEEAVVTRKSGAGGPGVYVKRRGSTPGSKPPSDRPQQPMPAYEEEEDDEDYDDDEPNKWD